MFRFLGYFKGQPTEYVIRYSGGRVREEGQGLTFVYFKPSTTIVAVPTGSVDVGFVFHARTRRPVPKMSALTLALRERRSCG